MKYAPVSSIIATGKEVITVSYKDYISYTRSRDLTWQILLDCGLHTLPTDLNVICRRMGIRTISYPSARRVLDALNLTAAAGETDGMSLYYNGAPVILYDPACTPYRIRFTVAHELGHILLRHVAPGQVTERNRESDPSDRPEETAANQFAARLLAPACVLWKMNLHTPEEIQEACHISVTAARHRAKRMEELYKRNKFLTHPLERKVFYQFFPKG